MKLIHQMIPNERMTSQVKAHLCVTCVRFPLTSACLWGVTTGLQTEQQVGLANDVLLRSEKVQLVSVVQFVAMGFLTRFWARVFPELLLFAQQLESA